MTEVNEEIVRQSLEAEGFFVKTDVVYEKPKRKTGKKSSGYGDIDILAEHPDGRKFLVQVKGWHTETLAPNYFRNKPPFIDRFAKAKAKETLKSRKFKTILVFSKIGKLHSQVRRSAHEQGFDYVKEFPEILQCLIRNVKKHRSYDSEVLQTIRVLKVYGFLNSRMESEARPSQIWTMESLEMG